METRFELKNVSKCYAGKRALDNVNLAVYEKKINAVTGESGCGKSTLAKVLVGLETHDTGSVMYKGKPMETVDKKEKKEFRKKNQVMFQNPLLSVNPCFKIGKILREPLLINNRGRMTGRVGRVNKQEINRKIGGLLEMLEIPGDLLDRYPRELSGGQLQRVVLARALVLGPEFIVLDEPFSALDEIMAARLLRCFKKVFEQLDIGVLFISHHLKRVEYLAHHVTIMKQGRIVHREKKGNY